MTQIKIEVPSNDPIALSALGEALQRIAAERTSASEEIDKSQLTGQPSEKSVLELCEKPFVVPTREDVERTAVKLARDAVYGSNVKFENTTTEEQHNNNMLADQIDSTTDIKQGEPCTESEVEALDELCSESDDTLDADGLPWDKRIHSRGKTRLADDTWRLARKPNDKTQEEWDEYVASVKAELKAVQDIPVPSDTVTPPVVDEDNTASIEDITQAEVDAGNLTPPVVETETVTPPTLDEQAVADVQASEPVAAVEPPASVTAPVVDNTPSVSTFQELMKYITSDAAKRGATNDMIKEVLAQVDPSLTAIPLIANRADLIPTFVAKLEDRLS